MHGLGDSEIDHLGYGNSVVQSHQDVGRLDITMDDAFRPSNFFRKLIITSLTIYLLDGMRTGFVPQKIS